MKSSFNEKVLDFKSLDNMGNKHYFKSLNISYEFWYSVVKPTIEKKWDYKCAHCGIKSKLDMHHMDYLKQDINTIIPLCRKCHRGIHNEK